MGTFNGWVKTIGGILQYAAVQGFLSNLEKLYDEADEDSVQWEAFLSAWCEIFHDEWVTTPQLVAKIKEVADNTGNVADSAIVLALPDALQISLREKEKSFSIILGKALEKRLEACFGDNNLRIERGKEGHTKVKKWRVVGDFADSADSSTHRLQKK